MKRWKKWAIVLWAGWIAFFCVLELITGVDPAHDVPMLTQFTVRFIPWWITMPLLLWLVIHFGKRYASPAYKKWLKNGGAGA